jgi:two-component system, LytTR family, response regulator
MNSGSISVIIVDDEPHALKLLEMYLSAHDDFQILDLCVDGEQALAKIKKLRPDVIFLDIQMPELTGLELIKQLGDKRPLIVFVTAYDKYAIKAFEENALDYLLKPFNKIRFSKMIDKVREAIRTSANQNQSDKIFAALSTLATQNKAFVKKLPVKEKGKIIFVPVEDIIWIESAGAFTKLHFKNGFKTHNPSLKQLEETLDPNQFLRVHKSYIANIAHVKTIEPYFHGEYIITMSNEVTLKLSRGYKETLDSILNQYR